MDLLTLFGVVFGGAAIVFGFSLEGGHFTTLFQLEAFIIVWGGTLGAVMIQNTWARFFDAVKQLRLAFAKARQVDRESLSVLLEWGDRAKLNGLLAFESMDVSGIHPFARRGLELLANGVSTAVLVWSQVLLSLQLPFAMWPLIRSVSDRAVMKEYAIGRPMQIAAWLLFAVITGTNLLLISGIAG